MPPRSKTGELIPLSRAKREELFAVFFQVGRRLLEWLFWRPLTRDREMPWLLASAVVAWLLLLLFPEWTEACVFAPNSNVSIP